MNVVLLYPSPHGRKVQGRWIYGDNVPYGKSILKYMYNLWRTWYCFSITGIERKHSFKNLFMNLQSSKLASSMKFSPQCFLFLCPFQSNPKTHALQTSKCWALKNSEPFSLDSKPSVPQQRTPESFHFTIMVSPTYHFMSTSQFLSTEPKRPFTSKVCWG